MNRGLILKILLVALLALGAAALIPALVPPSNCGGNSAAMSVCKQILAYDQWAGETNATGFDVAQLDPEDRTNLFRAVTSHWTPGAGYWFRKNDPKNSTSLCAVVVCDVVYSNVPQPTIWNFYRRNPAHAVGYSDGTVGLISPAEFMTLDRRGFISLTAIATNFFR